MRLLKKQGKTLANKDLILKIQAFSPQKRGFTL